jgi:hypothetical protein
MKNTVFIFFLSATILFSAQDSVKVFRPNPTLATALSFAIPGAGQIYNRSYWKAPIPMAAEGYTGYMIFDAANAMKNADADADGYSITSPEYIAAQNRWEKARDRRNIHLWILAGVVLLSTVDAYVDAELYPWTREMATPLETQENKVSFVPTFDPQRGYGFALNLTLNFP